MSGAAILYAGVAAQVGEGTYLLLFGGSSCMAGAVAGLMLYAFRPDRQADEAGAPWRAKSDMAGGATAALAWVFYPWQTTVLANDLPPFTIERWAGLVMLSVAALVPHLALSARDAGRKPRSLPASVGEVD